MQNNIKVALIEHRTGTISEIPSSLNQSELGFAYDANRLFIGNPNNEELSLRTTFPYQNVEILTEFSDLHNYVSYRYINNIKEAGGTTDPEQLIEREPFMIVCDTATNDVSGTLTLNDVDFTVVAGEQLTVLAREINSRYEETKVSVLVNNDSALVLLCTAPIFTISGTDGLLDSLGIPTEYDNVASELPERKMTEKLDDNLYITDFGVNASTGEVVSDKVMTACIEIYNRFKDTCTRRNIFFPAGTYNFDVVDSASYSIPLISGTTLYGEGINNTVFSFSSSFNAYCMQGMDSKNQYSADREYTSEIISDVVIKDLTLDCQGGLGSVYLRNMQNVRFENVRFVGNGNIVQIFGDSSEYKAKNITFENCVFDGGSRQISIGNHCENINIVGCRFSNATVRCVLIDGTDITRISCDGNTFLNGQMIDFVNYIGTTTTYVSFTNSKFDAGVSEFLSGNPRPFNTDFNASGKNYTDTLDPTTDQRKVLRFRFTQPKWDYISQLIDENGYLLFNTRRSNQELETSDKLFTDLSVSDDSVSLSIQGTPETASFDITNDKGDIDISSSHDLSLLSTNDLTETVGGNLTETITGSKEVSANEITETSVVKHEIKSEQIVLDGEVKIEKSIDLHSSYPLVNVIYNSGTADVLFKTTDQQLIRVYPETESPEEYGQRAIEVPNAFATTSMLKQYQGTIHGFATNNNVDAQGNIDIYDCSKYQTDDLLLKKISINFLVPPSYRPHSLTDSVFPYVYNTSYTQNTLIMVGGDFYRATSDFVGGVEHNTDSNVIGTYLTSETTVYDENGNVVSDFDEGDGFQFVQFSYKGTTLYCVSNKNESPMFLMHDENEDKPSPIDGEMMYCFTSGSFLYFIKNLPALEATQEQMELVLEKQIIDSEPIVKLADNEPFKNIIDKIDITLVSTNPLDSSDVKYYVLGRCEQIDGTFNISCSPWASEQLAGRVSLFQPEQKYNTGDIVRYQGMYYKCLVDTYTPTMTYDEKVARILDTSAFSVLPMKGVAYTYTGSNGVYETTSENSVNVVDTVDLETLNLSKCRIVLRFFDVYGNHIAVMNNTPEIESLNIGYFVEVIR